VGGNFIKAGGVTAKYIAKWSGNTWSALGLGLNGSVSAISVGSDDGRIYVVFFTTAGGGTAQPTAWRNGSAPSCRSADRGYVGGRVTTAGVVGRKPDARFDGTKRVALGSGMSGVISGVTSPSVNAPRG